MANNINWGKIYETSYWGVGVTTNTISWGSIYEGIAGGLSKLSARYEERVVSDGGVIESLSCLNDSSINNFNWDYYYRVIDDSGIVESLECVEI